MSTTRVFVDGVDYSPDGISALRDELINVRAEAMKQLPDSAGFVILITHTIALLADYTDLRRMETRQP